MLYFSKFKVLSIYIFIIIICFFTLSNFLSNDKNPINKKINLGLDLQGGSYLLLEIDNTPIILHNLQSKLSSLKNDLINNGIKFKNIKIIDIVLVDLFILFKLTRIQPKSHHKYRVDIYHLLKNKLVPKHTR